MVNKDVRFRNCLLNNKLFALIDIYTAYCKNMMLAGAAI